LNPHEQPTSNSSATLQTPPLAAISWTEVRGHSLHTFYRGFQKPSSCWLARINAPNIMQKQARTLRMATKWQEAAVENTSSPISLKASIVLFFLFVFVLSSLCLLCFGSVLVCQDHFAPLHSFYVMGSLSFCCFASLFASLLLVNGLRRISNKLHPLLPLGSSQSKPRDQSIQTISRALDYSQAKVAYF